jgi:micrococcal nuclease
MKFTFLLALICLPVAARAHPACGLYQYRAEITRVIDGDTVVADIDLGFHTWRRDEHLRLWGINAPEIHGKEKAAGEKSKDALSARVLGKQLIICTLKDKQEKYGRYLAKVYVGDELINDWLIAQGFAAPYMREGQ